MKPCELQQGVEGDFFDFDYIDILTTRKIDTVGLVDKSLSKTLRYFSAYLLQVKEHRRFTLEQPYKTYKYASQEGVRCHCIKRCSEKS